MHRSCLAKVFDELDQKWDGQGWYRAHLTGFGWPGKREAAHVALFESLLSQVDQRMLDYVSADGFLAMWHHGRSLLCYDMGRLSAGTMDHLYIALAEVVGIDPDMSEWKHKDRFGPVYERMFEEKACA